MEGFFLMELFVFCGEKRDYLILERRTMSSCLIVLLSENLIKYYLFDSFSLGVFIMNGM